MPAITGLPLAQLKPSQRAELDVSNDLSDPTISHEGRADARALDRIGAEMALRHHVIPLAPAGAVTPIACPSPAEFRRAEPGLRAKLGTVAYRQKSLDTIEGEILRLRDVSLAGKAENRTPLAESCRSWSGRRTGQIILFALVLIGTLTLAAPKMALAVIAAWTVVTLIAVTALRTLAALVSYINLRRTRRQWSSVRSGAVDTDSLPRISLLVPLFDETDIAGRLIERLLRLEYPANKLDACLILEQGDDQTADRLRGAGLPSWMRIVTVPAGRLRTKPRAMNYALDFARGDIVGVYDAEDRPAADQLITVARGFATADPDVACIQGALDFYNAADNWLTRCFAIDYAIWFRLVLPGLVRMGLPIPLGGTTVYFRRQALEDLGRWDAHNVTEDADLGIRLARRGYRCLFMDSVTEEEATASISTWVRQRSRWIKGYAVTWAVHMRDPLRLLGDLGPLRFLAFQILFLGTLSQFVLAPLLWSFWLMVFGLPHPVSELLSDAVMLGVAALFFLSEIATMLVAALAVATARHTWLIKWVPVLHLYFPLASIAFWKGLGELITRPFYWDKTAHGRATTRQSVRPRVQPLQRPV